MSLDQLVRLLQMSFAERSQIPLPDSLCCCPLLYAHNYLKSLGQLINLLLLITAGCSQVPDAPWPADEPLLVFSVVRSQIPWLVRLCCCPLLDAHKYLMSLGQLISLCWCSLLNAHKYLMSLGQLISLCWCSLLNAHNCRLMFLSLLLDRSCTNTEKNFSTFIAKNAI